MKVVVYCNCTICIQPCKSAAAKVKQAIEATNKQNSRFAGGCKKLLSKQVNAAYLPGDLWAVRQFLFAPGYVFCHNQNIQ